MEFLHQTCFLHIRRFINTFGQGQINPSRAGIDSVPNHALNDDLCGGFFHLVIVLRLVVFHLVIFHLVGRLGLPFLILLFRLHLV